MTTEPNVPPPSHSEEHLEKILRGLPHFDRNPAKEKIFLSKLHALIKEKNQRAGTSPARWWLMPWPRLMYNASSFALLLIVAGTVYAYQPSVTRGHFLYGWKRAGENIEQTFAFSPLQKVDTHVRFSDRRIQEAEHIVDITPDFSFLISGAHAANTGTIHLNPEKAINLALTLEDMRHEISLASEIVENSVDKPDEAQSALNKIENASDKHVQRLKKIEKNLSQEIANVVNKITDDEDENLASVVEAHEDAKDAVALKKVQLKIKFEHSQELKQNKASDDKKPGTEIKSSDADAETSERKVRVQQAVLQTVQLYQQLSDDDKKTFAPQIQKAQQALQDEKFGMAEGLSRATMKRIINQDVQQKIQDQKDALKAHMQERGNHPGRTFQKSLPKNVGGRRNSSFR